MVRVRGGGCGHELTRERCAQGGVSIGAGAGAAAALHSVLSRVVCARGAAGAHAALRMVCAVWRHDAAEAGAAYDLQATLLRVAHPLLQVLGGRYTHHAVTLFDTVGEWEPIAPRSDGGILF